MILVPQIIYATLCILFAYFNAEWIKADKPVNHKMNGWFHVVCWIPAMVFFGWQLIIVMPFIGKTVFDIALNKFRKLWIGYIPLPSNNGSKLDGLEYEVFEGDGVFAKTIYSLVIFLFNMFYFYGN